MGGSYEDGLVISDKKDDNINATGTESGNQFVWIPVEGATEAEKEAYFKRSNFSGGTPTTLPSDKYEPSKEGHRYAEEQTDYDNMYNSVIQYGGFYIGRYEAGINDASGDTSPRTEETAAQDVVSKAGVWPYNYVPWGDDMDDIGTSGAVYLAKNKYLKEGSDQAKSVVSTLVYGVQWDTMCKYIGAAKANMKPPTNQTGISKTKSYPNDDATGDVAKNIYDLAGNCEEYTMEAYVIDEGEERWEKWYRSGRGGSYSFGYQVYYRDDNAVYQASGDLGFRLALYIQ